MTTSVLVEELRATAYVRVEVREQPGELSLKACVSTDRIPGSFWHREAQLEVEMKLAEGIVCRIDGTPYRWDLEPTADDGVFAAFAAWVRDQIDGVEPGSMDDDGAPPHAAALASVCDNAAARAVRQCDPAARALALAFDPDARMTVYGALRQDWFRRVEQMIGVCPGLFVLASEVPSLWCTTLDGVIGGARLPSLIGALAATLAPRNRYATALTRRAPCGIPPRQLIAVLRDPNADLNDLLAADVDPAIWYAWCAAASLREPRLVGFVSKHVSEIDRLARQRGMDASGFLEEILDWTANTGATIPSRDATPTQVLAAVERWHAMLWEHRDLPRSAPFPPAPTPLASTDGISASSIKTVGELFHEGQRMNHCVGSHAAIAIRGAQSYFRAVVHGEPVTIAVARSRDGWHLVQASGFANRRPRNLALIHRWVGTLRNPTDAPVT